VKKTEVFETPENVGDFCGKMYYDTPWCPPESLQMALIFPARPLPVSIITIVSSTWFLVS
jgi:hypothetical protein